MPHPSALPCELATLDNAGLHRQRRTLQSPPGVDVCIDGHALLNFCSNDYLGLAAHPDLIRAAQRGVDRWGVGSTAAHLVSGHCQPHADAEAILATWVGCEDALLFSTGYMANTGIIPALVGRGDTIFADRLNHASLVDGALLSRADLQRYPHVDIAVLGQRLAEHQQQHPDRTRLIVTDSIFSMDGDLAPLAALAKLAIRHEAWLMIDDAHGLGVMGPQGQGCLAACELLDMDGLAERLVYVGTLGKAAGVSGAFAAGTRTTIDWLTNKARTAIFTTAAPPLLAEAICCSVELMRTGADRRQHLHDLITHFRDGMAALALDGLTLTPSATAIQPVIIGDNHRTLACARQLWDRGLWVPAIRPPTVPAGSARLRVSLTAAHTHAQVDRLLDGLAASWREVQA